MRCGTWTGRFVAYTDIALSVRAPQELKTESAVVVEVRGLSGSTVDVVMSRC